MSKRVSLAEMSRATGTLLLAEALHAKHTARPSLNDLTECLFFSPGDGRIWLDDQRVLLIRNSTYGQLREELVSTLGVEGARGLLTRAGYASGMRDAQLVREKWPNADQCAQLLAGMCLHALEGIVKVEPVRVQSDYEKGTYYGEFIWHNSCEADVHVAAYGVGSESACWNLVGYATGYVSTLFLGKLIIFREVECRASGARVCRVIGKPAEEWPDVEDDLRYLNAESFVNREAFGASKKYEMAELPTLDENPSAHGSNHMVGISAAFNSACHMLKRVASTQATVLFTGESGVGKELFAAMLHDLGSRKDGAFISVNCAAIPDTLVESELFGVERGAYTGATESRPGRFERADGGTLFLDEIGTLSLVAQGKLLRALQEGIIERVGGTRTQKVDVRLVAATNVDLEDAVRKGLFREDLFFRLNVYPIHLPPLRERRDDIPLLLSYFFRRYCLRHGRDLPGFTSRAVRALLNYAYPGNIRELQNLVERGVISADAGQLIDLPHIFRAEKIALDSIYAIGGNGTLADAAVQPAADEVPPGEGQFSYLDLILGDDTSGLPPLDALEQKVIEEAVARSSGNLAAAARLLGMRRAQLAYRLQKR